MAISDDESDLSDSLSSACSTVPLPSSELGSRAGSTHPPSPSNGDPSSSKSPIKPDRRLKGQVGRPKGSTTAALPIINDQDHPKKAGVLSRSHASVGPSTPSDIDRPIKCGSLPPPSSVKHPRRSSLSSNAPRSAKGQSFDSKSVNNLPSDSMLKLPNSVQHPCTSHGRLPLFEQPVLLQGARPRRVITTTTQKPTKPPKATRTKKRKNLNVTSDTLKPLSDNLSQKAQTYKDDESSLTEQSSSEEEVPSRLTTDGISCMPTKRSPSPTISHPSEKVNPQVGSSETTFQPINGISESARPTGSSKLHEVESVEPCPASTSSPPFNLVAKCDNNLTRLDLPSDSLTTPLKLESLTPTDVSPVLQDTLNIPTNNSSTPKLDPCKGKLKEDRGISEESALTPEPDDGRHKKSNHVDLISDQVNLPTSIPARIISASSPPKTTLSTPLTSPSAEPTNPPHPSLPSPSFAQTNNTTSSPSLHPQVTRPRTLSIIPTPFTDTKSGLSLPVLADQGPDTEPSSSTFAPSLLYQGWETGSSVPTPRLPDESSRQTELLNAVTSLTDDALDGEPITDDLTDSEFQFKGNSNPEPIFNNPSELLIAEDAVDGVPFMMDIDDQISISEDVRSIDVEIQERPPTPPITTVEPMVITESKPVITDANPIVERASSPPSAPTLPPAPLVDTIYECDDQARRREEALQAMVKIEIRFAQLRDRLYVERMADVHRETDAIHQGSHPELNEYYEMLERKRSSRLSLANKVFSLKEIELSKRREAATNAVWNKWNEVKTDLRNKMISETQCQIKQVERERPQPELRYNVEVQLLPKAIIPQAVRRKSRKRAKIEVNDGREEILALELRSAIAKRASINLSSLTPEESCMDLANMKPHQSTYNSHLDPIHILRPLPPPSQASTSSTIHTLPSQHQHQQQQQQQHHHHHSLTCSTDHLPNSSSSSTTTTFGNLPISCSKTIPNHSDSSSSSTTTTSLLLNRYRPTMNHTRASLSTIPDSITNPNNSNSIGPMMMGNPGIRKLDQRRPTLDAVMATTTTTSNNSFSSNSNGVNGNGVNGSGNSNSTSNICSSASSSNRHNLYPTLPITVNYH